MAKIVAETERLRLRDWDPEDLDEFIRHTNTEPVMRWLGGVQAARMARGGVRAHRAVPARLRPHLLDRRAKVGPGIARLLRAQARQRDGAPNSAGDFEVGWRLREDAWGQGYAKEAAIASLDLAFGRFGRTARGRADGPPERSEPGPDEAAWHDPPRGHGFRRPATCRPELQPDDRLSNRGRGMAGG